jgi:hypothetical protein
MVVGCLLRDQQYLMAGAGKELQGPAGKCQQVAVV